MEKAFENIIEKLKEYKYENLVERNLEQIKGGGMMYEEDFCYCHHDDTDEYHDCLDYMECEECPYYYAYLD